MAVPARVICDVFMGAVCAAYNMAAARRYGAALDSAHHLHLIKADNGWIGQAPRRTVHGYAGCNRVLDLRDNQHLQKNFAV